MQSKKQSNVQSTDQAMNGDMLDYFSNHEMPGVKRFKRHHQTSHVVVHTPDVDYDADDNNDGEEDEGIILSLS